jgi:hypothetical protein
MRAKVATSRYYTIAANSRGQHQQATLLRSPTFTFQRIPMRLQEKEPEQQEGGTKSIKKQIKSSIIEAAISLRRREHLLPGDKERTKNQRQETNTINQYNNYLLEPGVITWQKTEGR